jgi:UDP-N-acetylmuramyl pentapeptide phosphotransferase/UDP-N-acetylglucosamine-1-phosphate transferase
MFSFLLSFIVSASLTLIIIRSASLRGVDADFLGVQKVHSRAVPRIGGIGIFAAVLITASVSVWREPTLSLQLLPLLSCSVLAFAGGVTEDFTGRVSPMWRLILTMLAAACAYYVVDARIVRIDGIAYDLKLPYIWITLPLTMLAVAGIANAVNIIDGFNGLASVVTICMLLSLAYVALQVNDVFIVVAALTVAGATAGFLIWNYPAGLIFLGDGGAYFIGFMLGELALLLVMRNPQISTWYAALLLIYPTFETLFSVYRRVFVRGRSPGMPDGIHLHSLIFRRIVQWAVGRKDARALLRRNSRTSPYLWLFSLMAVIPATLFWRHTLLLILFCLLFIGSYVWLYVRIVRFRSPRWMILKQKD